MSGIDLNAVMDPHRFVGRAPQQVQQFVAEVVEPIRAKYQSYLRQPSDLRV
jgi:adenylosuccinate lyase